MITPNGGVFGRNPKFNNVNVAGTLTSAGNVTIGTGANLVMASGSGISFAATSDPSIPATAATGFFTRTATNVSDGDTVTIGTTVYTFKTALTPADYEVLISAVDAAGSLTNLRHAILGTGGTPGTDYQVPAAHPTVTASAIVGSVLPLVALATGTAGNGIALAETSAQLSVSGSQMSGGQAAGGTASELLADYEEGTWSPVYQPSSGTFASLAMTSSNARYVKVGNVVTVTAFIANDGYSVGTATGTVRVGGFPYVVSGSGNGGSGVCIALGSWGPTGPRYCVAINSTARAQLYRNDQTNPHQEVIALALSALSTGTNRNQASFMLTYVTD